MAARSEFVADGPIEYKAIEEVFVRRGLILEVTVARRTIGTMAEHPFYVQEQGWTPAGELKVGDLLATGDGRYLPVEKLYNTGALETVYHFRVQDHHTYFVADHDWGFQVWVHNAYGRLGKQPRLRSILDDPNASSADRGWIQQELNQISRGKRNSIRLPGTSRVRELKGVEYGGNSGKVLAHRRGYEAKKGFGYIHSDLQDVLLHKLQHKHEGY